MFAQQRQKQQKQQVDSHKRTQSNEFKRMFCAAFIACWQSVEVAQANKARIVKAT